MKIQEYERIGVLTLNEVFPHIEAHLNDEKKSRVKIKEFSVNVQSLRLKTFYHCGVNCGCCENKASFFAVERTAKNVTHGYHLNLYGFDKEGQEVLFTHDHILARALGGKDTLENTQTMCGTCNWAKGSLEQLLVRNIAERKILEEKIINFGKKEKFFPNP